MFCAAGGVEIGTGAGGVGAGDDDVSPAGLAPSGTFVTTGEGALASGVRGADETVSAEPLTAGDAAIGDFPAGAVAASLFGAA